MITSLVYNNNYTASIYISFYFWSHLNMQYKISHDSIFQCNKDSYCILRND